MITLYRKNASGIGIWSIWNEGFEVVISHATVLDGAQIQHRELVLEGKQSRSREEQVQFRIASRVSKQKDKGYVEDLESASKAILNQLGLDVPMLAQTFDESKHQFKFAHIQRKLNGLRCLATKQDGKIILYSRRGKPFTALHEIEAELQDVLQEGQTFDGELYHHGSSLQTIQSWTKRRQSNTSKIKYIVYDCIEDLEYEDRFEIIQKALGSTERSFVLLHATKRVTTLEEIYEAFDKALNAKFEGLMIRLTGFFYECGKRSKSLLKLKTLFEDEGICKGVHTSEKGNAVISIVWNDKEFNSSPPGNYRQRDLVLMNPDQYIGRRVTFEYRELTDDGIPFHAVATNWRQD